VRSQPWKAETEVEDLRALDVGIMPLPDDPWTRGKCGLKALQYMALGIPAVVSPVGVNSEIVRHGVNGYHATSSEEWIDGMARLLADRPLRERLGREARRTVEERYSARSHAPRLARILHEAAAG
jgi:glycosyltransferase involved in cell wall biosynthesis